MVVAVARVLWVLWNDARARRAPQPSAKSIGEVSTGSAVKTTRLNLSFALYLALIGLQSGIVWALSRCGALGPSTLRYSLLVVLVPIAVVAALLAVERRTVFRAAVIVFVLLWATVSVRAHGRLLAHYLDDPEPMGYRQVANELVARGIRYAAADYWCAYMIVFLTDERVIATATDYARVAEYETAVAQHANEAVLISRVPCPGGERLPWLYLCRPLESGHAAGGPTDALAGRPGRTQPN
jgi:hypothetical protein